MLIASARTRVYLLPIALAAFGQLGACAAEGDDPDAQPEVVQSNTSTSASAAVTPSATLAAPEPSSVVPGTASAPAPATSMGDGSGGAGGMGQLPPIAGVLSPVERHGQLRVEGTKILDASGQAVTLRGQGFGWDNWWPQYYNADVVNWLRDDWCVDMVRPAMGIEPDGAYLTDPDASRARVRAVVDAAIAKGVYVIIDWHAHDMHLEEATAFFTEMAQAYGAHPNVIYEVFNEPDEETWADVKAYTEAVGAAIRQHDPDNLIIVGSPEWNQRIDLAAAEPITALSHVVYSVHFYAATHTGWLRDRTAEAIAAGVPVIVSESSGSEAAGTGANDYTEWQAWIDFMDQNEISWINYSVSDKAGETISVLEPRAPSSGNWDASHLTETGEHIRNVFRSYCD